MSRTRSFKSMSLPARGPPHGRGGSQAGVIPNPLDPFGMADWGFAQARRLSAAPERSRHPHGRNGRRRSHQPDHKPARRLSDADIRIAKQSTGCRMTADMTRLTARPVPPLCPSVSCRSPRLRDARAGLARRARTGSHGHVDREKAGRRRPCRHSRGSPTPCARPRIPLCCTSVAAPSCILRRAAYRCRSKKMQHALDERRIRSDAGIQYIRSRLKLRAVASSA